jgi:uracil-DNA glycosylase
MDRLLEQARVGRKKVYVTNAVKHFKWEPRGISLPPGFFEACRPWLEAEIDALQPAAIVCLGATAAQAVLGRQFRVTSKHGQFVESTYAPHVLATVHPSAILRAPDEKTRPEMEEQFVADMKPIAKLKL